MHGAIFNASTMNTNVSTQRKGVQLVTDTHDRGCIRVRCTCRDRAAGLPSDIYQMNDCGLGTVLYMESITAYFQNWFKYHIKHTEGF